MFKSGYQKDYLQLTRVSKADLDPGSHRHVLDLETIRSCDAKIFFECALCPARNFYVLISPIRLKAGLARTHVQSTNILGEYFSLDENCLVSADRAVLYKKVVNLFL